MALHWEHVKGFNGDAATGTSTTAGVLYTYIEYQKGPKSSSPVSAAHEDLLPNIFVSSSNIQGNIYDAGQLRSGIYNCGHIVTNDVNTKFNKELIFKTGSGIQFAFDSTNNSPWTYNNSAKLYASGNNTLYMDLPSNYKFEVDNEDNDQSLLWFDTTELRINNLITKFLKNVEMTGVLSSSNSIITSSYVEALYFNATSDIRAKENILPVATNMLDMVKKIEVYTFNYKNNPSQRSIGILAQEVENLNIDGFSLVSNPNASGENGDYMSIHESKLVYILLEAVKELSAKVEKLEEKLYGC